MLLQILSRASRGFSLLGGDEDMGLTSASAFDSISIELDDEPLHTCCFINHPVLADNIQ
jgi:hypothetical protein